MKKVMSRKTKKILQGTLISLTVLFFIIAGSIWFLAGRLESMVRNTLAEEVSKSTDGLYSLQMGKIDVNPTNGTLHIKDLSLLIDSVKLYQLVLKNEKPHYTGNFTVKSIKVEVNKLFKIRRGGKLSVESITIDEPTILLVSALANTKNDCEELKSKQNSKLPFFSSATINKLNLTNGSIRYIAQGGKDTTEYSIESFLFNAENIVVDSAINTQNLLIHLNNAAFEANNIRSSMLDSALLFSIKRIYANLKDSRVSIDSLAVKPQYSKYEFARKTPNHSDIVEVSIKSILLSGVHFNEMAEKTLRIDSVVIDSLLLWSFKNKQIPPIIAREKPLLHQVVQRIPIPIHISTIKICNSEASYEELSVKGETPGKISFTDLNAEIVGLTNVITDKKQLYTIRCRTKLFGEGAVTATINLPVDPANDYFEVAGSLGKMNLTAINQMVKPIAFIDIKSGTVDHLDFVIAGNSKMAKTNMTFLYSNLKVDVLNPKKEDHAKRKFVSGIVNTLLIKSNNPSGKREPRKAVAVVSERNRFLSNFNYWWRGVKEGMLHSLGTPGK